MGQICAETRPITEDDTTEAVLRPTEVLIPRFEQIVAVRAKHTLRPKLRVDG